MANPFLEKRSLITEKVEGTEGRGYVDDDNPTPLTRKVSAVVNKLEQRMASIDKFVEDNDGFDQVALTPEEQVDLVSKLSIDDMEQLAGIFGPDVVLTARDEILKGAFSNGGGI